MFNSKLKKEIEELKKEVFGEEEAGKVSSFLMSMISYSLYYTKPTLHDRVNKIESKLDKVISYLDIEMKMAEQTPEHFEKRKTKKQKDG